MRITTTATANATTVASTAPMTTVSPPLATSDHRRFTGLGEW